MAIAVYPGSFDPFTLGHLDIVMRAAAQFDKVIICVMVNFKKKGFLTHKERVELIRRCIAAEPALSNVEVDSASGLLVDYARQVGASCMVKGIRTMADLEAENQMADINRMLAPELETFYLPARPELGFLSSTITRELASYHLDLERCVPAAIIEDIKAKFST